MSLVDQVIVGFDAFLRTTQGAVGATKRGSPARDIEEPTLTDNERVESGRLMRVNHCGEVCAQALYHGQATTAKDQRTEHIMAQAAIEEKDHLSWCEQRLKELDTRPSRLNPLWYASSFAMGALTGLMGDKVNLGFVAATEAEVCKHLDVHIERLPESDKRSRSILEQMRIDEKQHESTARDAGGANFPAPVNHAMQLVSRLMTRSTYWI